MRSPLGAVPGVALGFLLLSTPLVADGLDATIPPSEGRSGRTPDLSERMTLSLKDASLKDTLRTLADLLSVTPIMGTDVTGTLSIEAVDLPISEVIQKIESGFKLTIRFADGKMFVGKASGPSAQSARDELALSRLYLTDRSFPRRSIGSSQKNVGKTFTLSPEGRGSEARSVTFMGAHLRVPLPGCRAPVEMMLLGTDPFDGRAWIAFTESEALPGARRLAGRIGMAADPKDAASAGLLPLTGCRTPFRLLEGGDPIAGETAVSTLDDPRRYVTSIKLIEVDGRGETVLAAPRIGSRASVPWTVVSGQQVPPFGGARSFEATTRLQGGLLEMDDAGALLALTVSITRDVDPGDGSEPVTILIARGAETLRVQFGKPERWTISPTYGLGRSALVAEVTLTKPVEIRVPMPKP